MAAAPARAAGRVPAAAAVPAAGAAARGADHWHGRVHPVQGLAPVSVHAFVRQPALWRGIRWHGGRDGLLSAAPCGLWLSLRWPEDLPDQRRGPRAVERGVRDVAADRGGPPAPARPGLSAAALERTHAARGSA